jgi:iron complex outermembrane receptor protein
MNVERLDLGALSIALVALLAPHAACAQDAPETVSEGADGVGEIVVTARRRSERIQDVPVSVTAISGAHLDQNHQYQLEDLNTRVPSLQVSYFNPRGSYVGVRGLGNNPASDGLESSVGIFLDGVYLGRPGMAVFDLTDVEQIELLRGPQGTLFGKNTSAGALTISTQKPSFDFGGSIDVSIGNYDYLQTRGSVTGGLVPDLLAARVSFYVTSRDGWVRNPQSGARFNGSERQGGRLQFLLAPAPDLNIRLIGEYNREDDTCCALVAGAFGPGSYITRVAAAGGQAVIGSTSYVSLSDRPHLMRTKQAAVTGLIDYDFGELTLSSISGWRDWRYRASFDPDGSSARVFVSSSATPTISTQFSQEVRLSNKAGGPVDFTAGLYYFDQDLTAVSATDFSGRAANYLTNSAMPAAAFLAFNGAVTRIFADVKTKSYAGFAQITWHISPQIDFTGGIRGTYERKKASVFRPANVVQARYQSNLETDGFDPSWTASITFRPRAYLTGYATYSRGVKSGGLSPVVPEAGITADQLLVDSETTDNFEAGLKSVFADNRVRLNLSVFYQKVRDYQSTFMMLAGANPVSLLTNVGDVTSQGVELEANITLVRGLDIYFAGSYNDVTYNDYRNAPCPPERPGAACDLTGKQIANSPKWIGNFGAQYGFDVSPQIRTTLGGQLSYRDEYFGNLDSSSFSVLGDNAIVNLNLGIELRELGVDATFWIKNVFDRRYLTTFPVGGIGFYGAYLGTVADPQTFGLTMRKRF